METFTQNLDVIRHLILHHKTGDTIVAPLSPPPTAGALPPLTASLLRATQGPGPAAAVSPSPPPAEEELSVTRTELVGLRGALETLTAEKEDLGREVARLTAQLAAATAEDEGRREAEVAQAQRVQQCQRALARLEQDALTMEGQWDTVCAAVADLRGLTQQLGAEVLSLQRQLAAAHGRAAALAEAALQRDEAVARLRELERLWQAREDGEEEGGASLALAQQQIAEAVAYTAAVREGHEALQGALAAASTAAQQWEGQCARLLADRAQAPVLAAAQPQEETETSETSAASGEESDDKEAFVRSLEAKTVDLAISLQEAQSRAAVAEDKYEQLAAAHLLHHSAAAALQATLAASAPLTAQLRQENEELRASCVAAEGTTEPLLRVYQELLELHAQEVAAGQELRAQLARKEEELQELQQQQQQVCRPQNGRRASRQTAASLMQSIHQNNSNNNNNNSNNYERMGASSFGP